MAKMTDEPRKGQVEMPTEKHGSSYVEAATQMGSNAIDKMAPAEKGWILASVIVILGAMALLEVTNYMDNQNRTASTIKYFTAMEAHRSEETRRLQEQNRVLAQALARQSDRIGRQALESRLMKEASEVSIIPDVDMKVK